VKLFGKEKMKNELGNDCGGYLLNFTAFLFNLRTFETKGVLRKSAAA